MLQVEFNLTQSNLTEPISLRGFSSINPIFASIIYVFYDFG